MGARAIAAIFGEAWAIRPSALENIIDIAGREHEFAGKLEALEQKLGRPLMNTEAASIRDGVAIIPVSGPLFRYANLFTAVSGATSYETLALDLRTALDDPAVTAIVLDINSPGGSTTGLSELAKQVRNARDVKPIVAYVGGDAASAAYWLAAAAGEIVGSETSVFGSVGAMITVKTRQAGPGEKTYEFVSSVSPMKNADPGTPEGASELQRLSNELGQVFVDAVADYRGITVETVLENYGRGAVYTGTEALKRGMIDGIETFESVIARLGNSKNSAVYGGIRAGAATMAAGKDKQGAAASDEVTAASVAEQHPAVAEALRAEGVASVDVEKIKADAYAAGVKAENERITAIEALAMPGTEETVAQFKADTSMTAEKAAVALIKAAKAGGGGTAGATHIAALKGTEEKLEAPKAGSGSDTAPTVDEAAKAAVALARGAGINA